MKGVTMRKEEVFSRSHPYMHQHMLYAAHEAFYHLVEHTHTPLQRTDTDTLVVAMHTPALSLASVKARYKSVHLRTQFCDVLGISSTCQKERNGCCLWIMLFQHVLDTVVKWRLEVGL